ncbi:uncharacterized protein LOC108024861 isoform X2 [Drosophila biarmipes]|uniref:uncharacterized protein LOC108024861 isoform X2 n=1 Tax=Drosophila biarmipes TaxID=125945 RepID=UPI0007E67766|nr:uncharacterized protein LOC108024861 isoform X2 [Drosophila biarmipes]
MRFDLKDLLLLSMSTAPNGVIRRHKRFKCGKVSYLVHYELQMGKLLIRQVKRTRRTSSLRSRLQKRRRLVQRMLERGSGMIYRSSSREDGFTQTFIDNSSIAVGTEVRLETSASQTAHQEWISSQVDTTDLICTISRDQQTFNPVQQLSSIAVGTELQLDSSASQTLLQEWISSQVDTSDLIQHMAREQQTFNPGQQSLGCQTEKQAVQSRITQSDVTAKSSFTQTKLLSASLGSQTELHCTSAVVQTEIDSQHMNTQTYNDEEEVIKPHLQALYLIHDSIKSQSDLIEHEVLNSVNHLIDLTMLEVKQRLLVADLPREASLEPRTPVPVNQIGDNLQTDRLPPKEENKKVSYRPNLKFRVKRNQETQTEVQETQDAVVSVEMATQTEKERGRWTLKRS